MGAFLCAKINTIIGFKNIFKKIKSFKSFTMLRIKEEEKVKFSWNKKIKKYDFRNLHVSKENKKYFFCHINILCLIGIYFEWFKCSNTCNFKKL